MQGLESAESTQERGPFFNLSSLPTSSREGGRGSSTGSRGGGEGGRERIINQAAVASAAGL